MTQLVPVQRYDHVAKSDLRKTFQKTLKVSNCRESTRKTNSAKLWKNLSTSFTWFHGRKEIWRFERIFGLYAKCWGKEFPPLSNYIHRPK